MGTAVSILPISQEQKNIIAQIEEKVNLGIQLSRDEKMELAVSLQARVQQQEEISKQLNYYRKLVTSLEDMKASNDMLLNILYDIAEREKINRDSKKPISL